MHHTTHKQSLKDKSNHARIPNVPGIGKRAFKQNLGILSVSSFNQRDVCYIRQYKLRCTINTLKSRVWNNVLK